MSLIGKSEYVAVTTDEDKQSDNFTLLLEIWVWTVIWTVYECKGA